jgi:hypothetical protein
MTNPPCGVVSASSPHLTYLLTSPSPPRLTYSLLPTSPKAATDSDQPTTHPVRADAGYLSVSQSAIPSVCMPRCLTHSPPLTQPANFRTLPRIPYLSLASPPSRPCPSSQPARPYCACMHPNPTSPLLSAGRLPRIRRPTVLRTY